MTAVRLRRLTVTLVVAGLATLGVGTAASADVTPGCDGWAEFAGGHWTPDNDTEDNPIIVPPGQDEFSVEYFGRSDFDNNGHSGRVWADFAGTEVEIGDWKDENGEEPNDPSEQDTTTISLAEVRERVEPRGLVKVKGEHSSEAGSCNGFVLVKFEGPIYDSVLATASTAGMGIALLVLLLSAIATSKAAAAGKARGRPILGAIAGLLFGAFAAVMLQQASIEPLTMLTAIGLPALFLAAGLGLALGAPFGRGRLATAGGAELDTSGGPGGDTEGGEGGGLEQDTDAPDAGETAPRPGGEPSSGEIDVDDTPTLDTDGGDTPDDEGGRGGTIQT